MKKCLSIPFLALTFAAPAMAEICSQLQDDSTRLACFEDQSDCMQIVEHGERLACFDQHDYRLQETNVRPTQQEALISTTAPEVPASNPVVEVVEPALTKPAISSPPQRLATPKPAPELSAEVAIADRTPVPVEDPFPVRNAAHKETAKPAAPQLKANIASAVRNHRDLAILTLDNGQVWREIKKSRFRYQANMAVLITEGVMGSTNLQAEGMKKFVKVKRLK
jgi:hypothetical protein